MKKRLSDSYIFRKLVFLTSLTISAIAVVKVTLICADYYKTHVLYRNADDYFVKYSGMQEPGVEGEPYVDGISEYPWYEYVDINLDTLSSINPDVVGWIIFENEDISYPILYSGDNTTYLRTTYEKENATAGSIFIEGKNAPDLSDAHTILYGHNMRDLSMFGKLKYYKEIEGYFESHPYFQIFTKECIYRYQIIAFRDVAVDDPIYTVLQNEGEQFEEFVKTSILEESYVDSGMVVGETDHVVTLSTCSKENDRFVVSALRVDERAR